MLGHAREDLRANQILGSRKLLSLAQSDEALCVCDQRAPAAFALARTRERCELLQREVIGQG